MTWLLLGLLAGAAFGFLAGRASVRRERKDFSFRQPSYSGGTYKYTVTYIDKDGNETKPESGGGR